MPYSDIAELPESVRNNLPAHAQEIYMKALGLEQMCHIYSFCDIWRTDKRVIGLCQSK